MIREELTETYFSTLALTAKDTRWFLDRQVPVEGLTRSSAGGFLPVRKARVAAADGLFEFNPSGDMAYIFLALDQAYAPIDIIAWGKIGLLPFLGRAAVLGEEMAYGGRLGDAVDVFLTPLEWLQARRMGILVVDAARAVGVLTEAQPLQARSMDHARELIRMLRVEPRVYG